MPVEGDEPQAVREAFILLEWEQRLRSKEAHHKAFFTGEGDERKTCCNFFL
jgi:hypothetical protein